MISKKVIASTLAGTKALGLSGALAWALGLFDGEGLENVMDEGIDALEHEPELHEDVPLDPEDPGKQPEVQTSQDSQARTDDDKGIQQGETASSRSAYTSKLKTFFTDGGGSSGGDRKVVNSNLTWEIKWNEGFGAITVQIEEKEETRFLWRCYLRAISVEGINPSGKKHYSEFIRQKETLEEKLRDENNKKQFVKNCSKARIKEEESEGTDSEIEMETENVDGIWDKFKFKESNNYFEKVWTEDFTGIDRLNTGDEEIAKKETRWNINWEKEEKTKGKVTVSLGGKGLTCHISGNYRGDLGTRGFKENNLKEILELHEWSLNALEKKRYLIRNCRKNKEYIKGLTIQNSGIDKWEFKDLEKITEGMYTNPTAT